MLDGGGGVTLAWTDFVEPRHLIPVVGFPMGMKDIHDRYDEGQISMGEAAVLSAVGGAVYGTLLIYSAQRSYFAAMHFQRIILTAWNPMTYATIGLVAGVHATMKPGAEVSMGPYGSVRVMPRLGIF